MLVANIAGPFYFVVVVVILLCPLRIFFVRGTEESKKQHVAYV